MKREHRPACYRPDIELSRGEESKVTADVKGEDCGVHGSGGEAEEVHHGERQEQPQEAKCCYSKWEGGQEVCLWSAPHVARWKRLMC